MPTVPETKKFYLTSEFWVMVGVQITSMGDMLPTHDPTVRTVVGALAAAAYFIARGLAKSGVSPNA